MGGARFTVAAYLRDQALTLAAGALCAAGMGALLAILGNGAHAALLAAALVVLCFGVVLAGDFARKRRYYQELEALLETTHRAVYAESLLDAPAFLEGRIAHGACTTLARMGDAELVRERERARQYREYVEAWIHEAKTPIATAKLTLAGMRGREADRLAREIERIEQQVEAALYYARSTSLESDYRIAEIDLATLAGKALKRNARFLIEKGVSPHIEIPAGMRVLADETWTTFVLGQVVVNAAKYGAGTITFSTREEHAGTPHGRTVLEVADDGWGIPAADVPRVFDRGFTGANARAQGGSTGMGLYLCALLCHRMGLGITVASEEGVGTRVVFTFPHDRSRLNLAGM